MLGMNIKLNGSVANVASYGLTSSSEEVFDGMVQASPEWDGYSLVVVFNQGGVKKGESPVIDGLFHIPTNAMEQGHFTVSVYGSKENETLISIEKECYIYRGNTPDYTVPEKDIWELYVEKVSKYVETALACENSVEEDREIVEEHVNNFQSYVDNGVKVYNDNAETKLNEYNDNDTNKVNAYNENANDKYEAYNDNCEQKTDAYNSNAISKITSYNDNDSSKTSAYNENTVNKTNAFNQNAKDKSDLFDSKFADIDTTAGNIKQYHDDTLANKNTVIESEENIENISDDIDNDVITVKECKRIVEQAMRDLLAMINTDIATLVDGKLNPTQIPDISINHSVQVNDESELTSIEAQIGDMAYCLNDEGEVDALFWLVGADSTNRDDWKQLGLSFVSESGHALVADNAVNSTMINNKRLVTIEMENFGDSVTDDDTIYLVPNVSSDVATMLMSNKAFAGLPNDKKPTDMVFFVKEENE